MKTLKLIAVVFAVLFFSENGKAQDIHFSQYSEMPSSINPALSGVTYNTRVIVNTKSQWSTIGDKYQTYGFSFEQAIKHKKLKNNYFAITGNVFRDMSGDAKLSILNPNIGFTYLQRINKKMKFSGGLQTGFMHHTIDRSNMRFDNQFDGYAYNPSRSSGEPTNTRSSITSFDVGGGINLNFVQNDKYLTARNAAKFDVGVSAYHFGPARRNSFIIPSEQLATRFCVYFNSDFNIPGSINAIMPTFLVMRQGPNTEIIAGSLFKFIVGDPSTYTSNKKALTLSVGGYYRFRDAIIPSVLMQYNRYAFGVSYDINISALTPASRRIGGLEMMLRYNIWPAYGVNLGRTDTRASY